MTLRVGYGRASGVYRGRGLRSGQSIEVEEVGTAAKIPNALVFLQKRLRGHRAMPCLCPDALVPATAGRTPGRRSLCQNLGVASMERMKDASPHDVVPCCDQLQQGTQRDVWRDHTVTARAIVRRS